MKISDLIIYLSRLDRELDISSIVVDENDQLVINKDVSEKSDKINWINIAVLDSKTKLECSRNISLIALYSVYNGNIAAFTKNFIFIGPNGKTVDSKDIHFSGDFHKLINKDAISNILVEIERYEIEKYFKIKQ